MDVQQEPDPAAEGQSPVSERALIIFVKNPVQGKVKTRLIEGLGVENATNIYIALLRHTAEITRSVDVQKFVFYSDEINHVDLWDNIFYHKALQKGADLGERMLNAFSAIFSKGFKEVLIIGSDCFELSSKIILQGFEVLGNQDAVIGPAEDGGYYLLGLKKNIPKIFQNKTWSSSTVASDTISDFNEVVWSYKMLTTLKDVDLPEDILSTDFFDKIISHGH